MMGIIKNKRRTPLVQDYKWMDIWKEFGKY
jgi:hypothetical protein